MNYAVIKTGGKQYKVSEGDIISVERVTANANDTITFSEVLMVTSDGKTEFGQPFVDGLTVKGKVLEHHRGEKIRVAKFKAKARYRRVIGHRQELSKVQIEAIGNKPAKKAEPVTKKEEVKAESATPKRTRKTAQK